MLSIFTFEEYSDFITKYIELLPKKGWGFATKMCEYCGIQQALFSQILSKDKDFTPEQALKFATYIKLNEIESEYFLEMVFARRSNTKELKEFHSSRIQRLQKEGLKIKNHITDQKDMAPEEKMEFYSNFLYSAIRNFTSIEDGKTFDDIQKHFNVPPLFLKAILEFLVKFDLCQRRGDRYKPGQQKTWAEKGTPYYFKHSTNWRLQGISKLEMNRKDDFFITSPMSMSAEDVKALRNQIVEFVKDFSDRVKKSETVEETVCLNIDFFKF